MVSGNTEILELLSVKCLGEIVLDTFPVGFVTQHTKKQKKSVKTKPITFINISRYWLGSCKFFLKNMLNIFKATQLDFYNTEFEILFYLPNTKYEGYLNSIIPHLKVKYFVISDNKLNKTHLNSIELDDLYIKGQFTLLVYELLFFITYPLFLFAKRNFIEIKRLIANRSLYHMLFINLVIFNKILNYYKFEKYFSLLPNGNIHRIIQLYFKKKFSVTYGIRPEQLVFAEEERFNNIENLFYKNNFEKMIFRNLNLNRTINLLKGSILIDKDILINQRTPKKINNILILDTCTNENPKSDFIRDKGIKSIYTLLNKHMGFCNFYHKFHPGLNYKISKDTRCRLVNEGVKIIESIENYCIYDLVISYYSSLVHPFILSQVPVLVLTGELDLNYKYQLLEYDLDKSPIKKTYTITELNNTFRHISEVGGAERICNTKRLFNWYKDFFNYPDGLDTIINLLNRKQSRITNR